MTLLTCYNDLTNEKKCLVKWTVQLYVLLDMDTDMILRLLFGAIICLNSDKTYPCTKCKCALIFEERKRKGREGGVGKEKKEKQYHGHL